MCSILLLLILISSPFVFAGGANIKALAAFIHLSASLSIMLFLIKRGNTLIHLFLVIILGVLAGMAVSIYFGFFVFGFCSIYIDTAKNPLEASHIANKCSLIAVIIIFSSILLSYCLALYEFFT